VDVLAVTQLSHFRYGLAWGSFLFAFMVIAVGLYFSFRYHDRLMRLIRLAIRRGTPFTLSNEDVGASGTASVQARVDTLKIKAPSAVKANEPAKFELAEVPDGVDVGSLEWSVESGGMTVTTHTGPALTHTFEKAGTYTVSVVTVDGAKSGSVDVTLADASAAPSPGVPVFPFVMRNWSRFVVVIAGTGFVSALMFADVISAEGGIGLLGALLGVGASTSAAPDPASTGGGDSGGDTGGSGTTPPAAPKTQK
jgi:hypothetical protein